MAFDVTYVTSNILCENYPASLPNLYAGVMTDAHPYFIVMTSTDEDGDSYFFISSSTPIVRIPENELVDELGFSEDARIFCWIDDMMIWYEYAGELADMGKMLLNYMQFEDITWSNHDILDNTTGDIYFFKSGDATVETTNNTVTLPDIPTVDNYPYQCVIVLEYSQPAIVVMYTQSPIFHLIDPLPLAGSYMVNENNSIYSSWYTADTDSWSEAIFEEHEDMFAVPIGEFGLSVTIIWSNHDIMTVELAGEGDTSYVALTNDIYFLSPAPLSEVKYDMPFSWYKSIGDAMRQIFGITSKVTPRQANYMLYNISIAEGVEF